MVEGDFGRVFDCFAGGVSAFTFDDGDSLCDGDHSSHRLGFPLEVLLLLSFPGNILLVDPHIIRDLFSHLDFARHFNTFLFGNNAGNLG